MLLEKGPERLSIMHWDEGKVRVDGSAISIFDSIRESMELTGVK